jgi:hypothetical protein
LQEEKKDKHKSNNKTLGSSKVGLNLIDFNGWISKIILYKRGARTINELCHMHGFYANPQYYKLKEVTFTYF